MSWSVFSADWSSRKATHRDAADHPVGIVAAFLGTALARAMGIPTATSGVDWLELLVQVVVAALGVALVAGSPARRRSGILRR